MQKSQIVENLKKRSEGRDIFLFKKLLIIFIGATFIFSIGCAQVKTRKQISKTQPENSEVRETVGSEDSEDFEEGLTQIDGDFQEAPAPRPQQKTAPRLGLILGAGGARAFAHAGVLKALDTERIPVHAVVGLEWGSLMAGAFAQEGRVHNLDWKLYKLKEDDLPGQSLLSKTFSKDGIGIMENYLKTVFENTQIENAKVDFACPSISTQSGVVAWMEKGSFRSGIQACLPYTPLFAAKGGRFAAPFDLEQAAQWLRRQGADVVVFVDVLTEGQVWSRSSLPNDESSRLLWWELQRHYKSDIKGIDEVIRVPLAGYNLSEFSKRKKISEVGHKSGRALTRQLMQKYNF